MGPVVISLVNSYSPSLFALKFGKQYPPRIFISFSAFHDISVYPQKELPFFILFSAALCSFSALVALLTHQFPDPMARAAHLVS